MDGYIYRTWIGWTNIERECSANDEDDEPNYSSGRHVENYECHRTGRMISTMFSSLIAPLRLPSVAHLFLRFEFEMLEKSCARDENRKIKSTNRCFEWRWAAFGQQSRRRANRPGHTEWKSVLNMILLPFIRSLNMNFCNTLSHCRVLQFWKYHFHSNVRQNDETQSKIWSKKQAHVEQSSMRFFMMKMHRHTAHTNEYGISWASCVHTAHIGMWDVCIFFVWKISTAPRERPRGRRFRLDGMRGRAVEVIKILSLTPNIPFR